MSGDEPLDEANKAGARHSRSDNEAVHDLAVGLGAECGEPMVEEKEQDVPSFSVFKDRGGKWRWVGITSTAYLDRDGEHVSQAALKADAERMDAEGRYGPLRWWHMGKPDPLGWATKEGQPWGPGIDLGYCDFVWALGPFSIESGGFLTEEIGAATAKAQADTEFSKAWHFAAKDRDATGTYHGIKSFERSLLPMGIASNLLTSLVVAQKGHDMATPAEKLKTLTDMLGEEATGQVLDAAASKGTLAKALGLSLKELIQEEKADKKRPPMDGEDEEEEGEDMPPRKKAKEAQQPDLAESLKEAFAPIFDQLQTSIKQQGDAQEAATKEVKDLVAGLEARLKELEGGQPRAFGWRPSVHGDAPAAGLKEQKPQNDSVLLDMFMGGVTNAQTPPQ